AASGRQLGQDKGSLSADGRVSVAASMDQLWNRVLADGEQRCSGGHGKVLFLEQPANLRNRRLGLWSHDEERLIRNISFLVRRSKLEFDQILSAEKPVEFHRKRA